MRVFWYRTCLVTAGLCLVGLTYAKATGTHRVVRIDPSDDSSAPIDVFRFTDVSPEVTVSCYVTERYGQHAISCVKVK